VMWSQFIWLLCATCDVSTTGFYQHTATRQEHIVKQMFSVQLMFWQWGPICTEFNQTVLCLIWQNYAWTNKFYAITIQPYLTDANLRMCVLNLTFTENHWRSSGWHPDDARMWQYSLQTGWNQYY
jgi:hypothetical protein